MLLPLVGSHTWHLHIRRPQHTIRRKYWIAKYYILHYICWVVFLVLHKKGQNMLINWCYDIVWWYQIDMLLRVMVECVQVLCGAADTWRVYIGPSLCLVSTPSIFAISKWISKNVFSQNYIHFLKKHFSMRPCAKSGQEQLEKLRISGVRWGPVVFEKRPQYSTHVWIPWDSKTFQYRGFWEEAEFLN